VKLAGSLFIGLFGIAATLIARVQIQGLDAALAAIAIENGVRAVRAGSRVFRGALHWTV
jgi:hypothetical protein